MTRPQLLSAIASTSAPALDKAAAIQLVMECWADTNGMIPTREAVLKAACIVSGADYAKVKNRNRSTPYKTARQLFFYYLRTHFESVYYLQNLADFTNMDHTTVIHGVRKIGGLVDIGDLVTQRQLQQLENLLTDSDYVPAPVVVVKKSSYKSVRKYIFDNKTGEKYDSIFELNKGLNLPVATPFPDVKRRFGLLRFEWKTAS